MTSIYCAITQQEQGMAMFNEDMSTKRTQPSPKAMKNKKSSALQFYYSNFIPHSLISLFCSIRMMKKLLYGWTQLALTTTDKKHMNTSHCHFAREPRKLSAITMRIWEKLYRVLNLNSVDLMWLSKVRIFLLISFSNDKSIIFIQFQKII